MLLVYEEKLLSGEKLTAEETEVLENRRIFYHLAYEVGLSSYIDEWWHKDCGNQFDAGRTGKAVAIYGAADFSEECKAWEDMRVRHYLGSLRCLKSAPPATKLGSAPLVQLSMLRCVQRATPQNPTIRRRAGWSPDV